MKRKGAYIFPLQPHKHKPHTDFGLLLTDAGALSLYNATGAACSPLAPRGTALPPPPDAAGADEEGEEEDSSAAARLRLPLGQWTHLAVVLGARSGPGNGRGEAAGGGGGGCNVLVYRDGELVAAASTLNLTVRPQTDIRHTEAAHPLIHKT